jgi:hypothetical protein
MSYRSRVLAFKHTELHHEKDDDPQKFKPDSADEIIFSTQVRKNAIIHKRHVRADHTPRRELLHGKNDNQS